MAQALSLPRRHSCRRLEFVHLCAVRRSAAPRLQQASFNQERAGGRTAPRSGCHRLLGQSGLFPTTSLAFLAVYTLKLDPLRCVLDWRDVRKSFCFNNLNPVFAVFYRKCNDMRIFGPLRSLEKRGQPPILAPRYCWKQWGSTRLNRLAVSFFRWRIRSGNQSLTRTSGNPNGGRVASVGCCMRKRLTPHFRVGL